MRARILSAICCLFLSACSAIPAVVSVSDFDPRDFFKDEVNLMDSNYRAADYMAGQAKNFIRPGDTIRVLPLLDIQEPRLGTTIGKKIPEQVGERFAQLGYDVDLAAVQTGLAPAFDPVRQPVFKSSDYTLSGEYVRKSNILDVRLRLQETGTGRELSSFSYELPRTAQIRSQSKPQPVINKTSP